MSEMEASYLTEKRRRRAKLIFNPASGSTGRSPVQLMDLIREMQRWKLVPEVFLIEPDCDVPAMVEESLARGVGLFVACGGDGTVSSVARELAGKRATMGIIPTGTQNNIALSLGIPKAIPEAVALLRAGRRLHADLGTVTYGGARFPFFEVCSVGLLASIFSSGDEIQHGHVERLGDFLGKFVGSPPSKIHVVLDGRTEIETVGHFVLLCNMPYIGRNFAVGDERSFRDGILDVYLFRDISKIGLLNCLFRRGGLGEPQNPGVQHFRVRSADISATPDMTVMADGVTFGKGGVHAEILRGAIALMLPRAEARKKSEVKESTE